MVKTKTTNLISTPNINGNIGSCAVQSNEVKVNDSIFTAQYRSIQINSCTGAIVSDQIYTSYTGVWITLIFGIIIILGFLSALSSDY